MTGRERIEAVLEGRKPDHTPFVPLIGRYYVNSLPEMGIPLEKIAPWEKATSPALKDHLNMHEVETIRYVGGDVFYRHVMAFRTEYDSSIELFHEKKDGIVVDGFRTPVGEIFQEVRTTGGTDYISRHMLSDPKDLEVYLYVLKGMNAVPFYSEPREMDEFIGDDGLITLTGPVTPIQEMLQFKMGVENTTFALIDFPDEMENVFEEIQRYNLDVYKILAQAPAKVVITYEDTSTTILSPDWYTRYCSDELNQYADIVKKSGQKYIAHMCGHINLLTELIAPGRMDGIDSVCPPETGDIEPGAACTKTGKLIIGGLDPAFLVHSTPEQCVEYARKKLDQIPPGSDFMLSTGDSTAAYTPVDNLRAISKFVKDYVPAYKM